MKRKSLALILSLIMVLGSFVGCTETDAPETPIEKMATDNEEAFRLSGVEDVTDENGNRAYKMVAPYTDTYTITSADVQAMKLYQDDQLLAENGAELEVSLTEGEEYVLAVETAEPNASFAVHTEAQNNLITLPYDCAEPLDISGVSLESSGSDPVTAAEVNYVPREGGTYIYSNNPEQIAPQHVGQAFIRNEGLTGEVYVTFEHANYSGAPLYLGYQLKNDSDHDVYVTVTNVGYQWTGTWFGQLAWYDFYNTHFELPNGFFDENGNVSKKYSSFPDYAYQDYEPRVFQPVTYRLPAGEYFWVIGGTEADSYNHINVDGSADQLVNTIRCANGNVKFTVSGGEVTGAMYAYTDASQIADEPEQLGYVAEGYALQYSGIAYHHGVIDNYMDWTFNDETVNGPLPVTYTNYYDDNRPAQTLPYAAYNSTPHEYNTTTWMTHLNPQNDHSAVGMDLVEFIWVDDQGDEVIIDNDHADGAGQPANTANWMIEYQDHFTFVNQGDKDRTVKMSLKDHGTLALLVRDTQTGEVLKAKYTMGLVEQGMSYSYTVTIPAHSTRQITLDYLLVACSYGSVQHLVSLGTAE